MVHYTFNFVLFCLGLFGLVGSGFAQVKTLTKDLDHDGIKDSINYFSESGTLTVKLSSRGFQPISSDAFKYEMGYRDLRETKSGFEFIYDPAKAPYCYQFWYDKPTKRIRLIGISHSETAFAGRETGEISANLLTDQFIAEWTRLEEPDFTPNKQVFKSEIHYPKVFLTEFDGFSIDQFDEKLMWSIEKSKEAWERPSTKKEQGQRFPKNKAIEFTGTIARQPVLVELTDTENGLMGRYKYLKVGTIIPLEGVFDSQHGNAIELEEGKEQGSVPQPVWRAVYRHDSVVGKWKSADKKKTYPIQLAEKKEEAPLIRFQSIEKDTVVYSNPKDTTSPKFTYHNRILQAKGNGELSRWMNAEMKKNDQTYRPQYSMVKNMIREMKDQIIVYIESVADADDPATLSWNWDFENTTAVSYQEKGYLSLSTEGYEFSGGAHGNAWEAIDNYDLKNRRKLLLNDIIRIDSTVIETLLEQAFRQQYDVKKGESLKAFGLFESVIKPTNNFFFDDWGVTLVYNQYEIGPYALGIVPLFIPWKKLQPYLHSSFNSRMGLLTSQRVPSPLRSYMAKGQTKGLWTICYNADSTLVGFKNDRGEIKIKPRFSPLISAKRLKYIAGVYQKQGQEFNAFYLTRSGKEVKKGSLYIYDNAPDCENEGFIRFRDKQTGGVGLLNREGKVAIPATYKELYRVHNGMVAAIQETQTGSYVNLLLDTTNTVLIQDFDPETPLNYYAVEKSKKPEKSPIKEVFAGENGGYYTFINYGKECKRWFENEFIPSVKSGDRLQYFYSFVTVDTVNGWIRMERKAFAHEYRTSLKRLLRQVTSRHKSYFPIMINLLPDWCTQTDKAHFFNHCGEFRRMKYPLIDLVIMMESGVQSHLDFLRTEDGYKLISVAIRNTNNLNDEK